MLILFHWLLDYLKGICFMTKGIPKKNAPSNKTQALTKNINMDIRVVGTLNQLFEIILKLNFQKSKVISGKIPFLVMSPFCTSNSIWLLTGQFCMENLPFQL